MLNIGNRKKYTLHECYEKNIFKNQNYLLVVTSELFSEFGLKKFYVVTKIWKTHFHLSQALTFRFFNYRYKIYLNEQSNFSTNMISIGKMTLGTELLPYANIENLYTS